MVERVRALCKSKPSQQRSLLWKFAKLAERSSVPRAVQFDYEKANEVLAEDFLPKDARRLYYSDLYGRQQGEIESVEEVSRSMQQLTRRAFSDMPSEYQDRLMREHFISGLRKSVQRMVILQDPDNSKML